MARSIDRLARVIRFSSTGNSVPPASIESRRRLIARSASSSEIDSNRPQISSNSPATMCFGNASTWSQLKQLWTVSVGPLRW